MVMVKASRAIRLLISLSFILISPFAVLAAPEEGEKDIDVNVVCDRSFSQAL
jgi:hypothetical protein